MNLGHEKALAEMNTKLTEQYVRHLEAGNTEKEHTISTLSLHLGLVAGSDKSPFAQQGRKYLYEKGLYNGNDGSIFGKQLEEEFGSK